MHSLRAIFSLGLVLAFLSACSTNPATGRSQFTGLMSPQAEVGIGADEHRKIVAQMGLYQNQSLQSYVNRVGQKLVPHTERKDVRYQFFIVDNEMVNAFALPGGYIYVTRGLLAFANNEAELAAVLAHEIGHVTGRHSAERYSRGVVTGLGAAVLGAAIDNSSATKAINTGTNLWMKSYSRDQESEADDLGIRYLYQAGYDPFAMSTFLATLKRESQLQTRITGQSAPPTFLSTHPDSGNRSAVAAQIAGRYTENPRAIVGRNNHLKAINGMTFGSSGKEGFARGQTFIHPQIGFQFTAPSGFEIINKPSEVISRGPNGAVIVFDFNRVEQALDPVQYMSRVWMKNEVQSGVERITINGMRAATTAFGGTVGGAPVTIRLVAVEWSPGNFARFQMAIPQGASQNLVDAYRRMTYSFKKLTNAEKNSFKPEQIKLITAGKGDTVASLSNRMPFEKYKQERFRILNGLGANQSLKVGEVYKVVVQ